jgi:hypothetical protein
LAVAATRGIARRAARTGDRVWAFHAGAGRAATLAVAIGFALILVAAACVPTQPQQAALCCRFNRFQTGCGFAGT